MVVQMESITPIPEPASLVLMGGAFAMITVARRKFLI
jgi:hypothetical protein